MYQAAAAAQQAQGAQNPGDAGANPGAQGGKGDDGYYEADYTDVE